MSYDNIKKIIHFFLASNIRERIYLFHNQKQKIMKNLTLTQIIEELDIFILDTQSDLTKDWNEEKELMSIQLQNLLIAKANLELILKTGNQIFKSSIRK